MAEIDLERMKGLLAEAAPGPWSIDAYGGVNGPDGRTVEVNGFASVCSPGNRQTAAHKRSALIVAAVNALPALIARLEAVEEERDAFAMAAISRQSRVRELEEGLKRIANDPADDPATWESRSHWMSDVARRALTPKRGERA